MTLYHTDYASSNTHVVCTFFHTKAQSTDSLSCVTRISRGLFSAIDIVCKVLYARRLWVLGVSASFGGSVYAMSSAYMRRYTIVLGVLPMWGGLLGALADPRTETTLPSLTTLFVLGHLLVWIINCTRCTVHISKQTEQDARYIHQNKLYKMHGTYIKISCTKCTVHASKQTEQDARYIHQNKPHKMQEHTSKQTEQDARYIHKNERYKMHGTYIKTNCTRCKVHTSTQKVQMNGTYIGIVQTIHLTVVTPHNSLFLTLVINTSYNR